MAKVTCAISGIQFTCAHLPIVLPSSCGYYHPVFAIPRDRLYDIYTKHCQRHLTPTDSYLLFLALLHSTDSIQWTAPADLDPEAKGTIQLIENNVAQLLAVIELSDAIITPAFKQPKFVVRACNNSLAQIPAWIHAWRDNIAAFDRGYANQQLRDDLVKIENRLSYLIKSGLPIKDYGTVIAQWANAASIFPEDVAEDWEKVIRTCYNSDKMFSTPLATLKEIKAHCEQNIEAGSIHFHTLQKTLKEGISRHTDFLGMSSAELGYTLMPIDSSKNDIELEAIRAKAPTETPSRLNYTSDLAFIRAKMAYSLAQRALKVAAATPKNPLGEL